MRKILFTLIFMLFCGIFTPQKSYAYSFSNETLQYVITYKWGLIDKEAGTATLTLSNKGQQYDIRLYARTKPWADKVFKVRDTLISIVDVAEFRPRSYVKISHEGGKYSRDDIKYEYVSSGVTGKCTRYREKKNEVAQSQISLKSASQAYDMLSIFYYLRMIDYDKLKRGEVFKTTVFSGVKQETLTVKSLGIEDVKLRKGGIRRAYHLQFNFTTGGKKKSSDDIDAWISADSRHIPLSLIGKLPIGQVRVYLV